MIKLIILNEPKFFRHAPCTLAPYIGMKTLTKFLFRARNILFPSSCALCGGNLFEADEIRESLCGSCSHSIEPVYGPICIVCGKPLVSEIERCLSCRNREEERFYERIWVLFPYTGKYRKLLTSYKFKNNLCLANFFAQKIANLIMSIPELKEACIVPVPPRPGKIKKAGWDQVDHLVKKLGKLVNFPVVRCLKRMKSKIQKSLSRAERLKNLKGKIFQNASAPEIALIIDDVITTGSTMEVCAQTLKNAGAKKVYGICLFYD